MGGISCHGSTDQIQNGSLVGLLFRDKTPLQDPTQAMTILMDDIAQHHARVVIKYQDGWVDWPTISPDLSPI